MTNVNKDNTNYETNRLELKTILNGEVTVLSEQEIALLLDYRMADSNSKKIIADMINSLSVKNIM